MNTTYTLTEGNDALNRVLLMMRYDLGKTLDENVILEQVYTKTNDGNYELKNGPWEGIDANKIFPSLKQNEYPKKLDSDYSPIGGIPDDVLDFNRFRPSISPKPYQYTEWGYPKSSAYYPRWKKEWKQKHPGKKLGYEQQTLDQHGRASTVWVDEYGKESPIVIEAPTLSEGLLKLRDFFYTPTGMVTQVVLSIAGAEIGVPIVFEILDGVIIVNDAYIMVRDWNPNGPKMSVESGPMGNLYTKGLWEWFKFHFNNNIGFQYLCVDVLAVLAGLGIMGLGKSVIKSAKGVFNLLVKYLGKKFPGEIAKFLEKLTPKSKGLPKKIGSWVDKKMSEVNKAIEIWKTPEKAVKSVTQPGKLILAGVAGYGTYKLTKWFESKADVIMKFFEKNPENNEILVTGDLEHPTTTDLINAIIDENPKLFKPNFKPKSFKVDMIKKGNGLYPQYYIIDGVKYSPVDLTKGLEIKKMK